MGHFGGHMNFDDLMGQKMYNEFGAYAQSKLANILFTKHLAKMLEGTGVVVNAVHPGVVHTGFAQGGTYMSKFFYNVFGFAMDTPEKGARTSLHAALSEEGGRVTGQYFSGQKVKTPSREARDPEIAARLWDVSMKLTGLAK
jgi:NAD(P)-dependent dehydrogenase (short-subunit alcohol dehydrogenase family)